MMTVKKLPLKHKNIYPNKQPYKSIAFLMHFYIIGYINILIVFTAT